MEDKAQSPATAKMLEYLETNKAASEVDESMQKFRINAYEAYRRSKISEERKKVMEGIFDFGHTLQNRGNMNADLKIDRVDCCEKPRKSMPSAEELTQMERLEQKANGN